MKVIEKVDALLCERVSFAYQHAGSMFKRRQTMPILFDVNLSLRAGETLGILGESG